MTGNCLRGSRPLLSFDDNFTDVPYLALLRELFVQTFGVPNHHPKSQPFFDHIYTFTFVDNRIWFRNFQILSEDGGLAEVGPRFVLNPVKIFDGSFGGDAIWENPDYVSPAKYRQIIKKKAKDRYVDRIEQKANYEATKPKVSYNIDDMNEVFDENEEETAQKLLAKEANRESSESEDEEIKNIQRKEKKQLHKVKKLISKKKELVNKSIAKKTKKMKKTKSA